MSWKNFCHAVPSPLQYRLDVGVLGYRNRKLKQQMETLKVEYSILESKISYLEDKQIAYDDTISVINKSWEQLVDNLKNIVRLLMGMKMIDMIWKALRRLMVN